MIGTEDTHNWNECVGIQTGNICESHLLLDILGDHDPKHISRMIFLTFKQGIAFATMMAIVSAWKEEKELSPLNYDPSTLSEQSREVLLELATEMIADLKKMNQGIQPGKMQ